jgi:ribosome-binding ATPase
MILGIVGKPNCGKSTFFKAATLMDVEIANYPFATIEPNKGIGFVRVDCIDKEFNKQCNPREGYCIKGTRFVPVDIIDVAGLVPGAYEGKGMGNKFLDDLRQANCLIHVIDASGGTNEKGESVNAGEYDPANDIKFLENELDMWYLGIFMRIWEKFSKTVQQTKGNPAILIERQFSGLGVTENIVKKVMNNLKLNPEKITHWTQDEVKSMIVEFRKITKPMIIAANKIDTPTGTQNLKKLIKEFPEHTIIGCSAESELALREASKHNMIDYLPGEKTFKIIGNLNEKQKSALNFIQTNVLNNFNTTGVQNILDACVFNILEYIAIYPGGVNNLTDQKGNILPDCFLMKKGSTPLDFAFKLHTDFGKNYIKAINVKTKLPIAKDYILNHRDIIEIMSNK